MKMGLVSDMSLKKYNESIEQNRLTQENCVHLSFMKQKNKKKYLKLIQQINENYKEKIYG